MGLDALFKQAPSALYETTEPSLAPNERHDLRCDDTGRLLVNQLAVGTTFHSPGVAAAEKTVKSSAGRLYMFAVTNAGGADVYVSAFDAAARPSNGSTSELAPPVKVPAGGTAWIELPRPREFSAGLYIGASSTANAFTYSSGASLRIYAEYS